MPIPSQLIIMVHNLMIIDYGLDHLGSIHNVYAFQGMWIIQEADNLIPDSHWIWADSTYPTKTWCMVPFKAMQNTLLLRPQKIYNQHLSKVHTVVSNHG